jgi:GNAT acetyltransferase-like protein
LVTVLSPAPRDSWNAILSSSDEATAFHTPEWLDVCCRVGGYRDASRLYETVDGRRLVLPLVSRTYARRWDAVWSMPPNWGFGGVLAQGRVTSEDVETVVVDIRNRRERTIVRPGPLTGAAWATVPARVRVRHDVHVVDLEEGIEGWWRRLSSGTRYKVRRAERKGVSVEWDSTGRLIPTAWDLYLRWASNRERASGVPPALAAAKAEPNESLPQFAAVAEALGSRSRLGLASIGDTPVAYMIMLLNGAHAHYWRGHSDHTLTRGAYPNHLLLAQLIEQAAAAECRYVHLGEFGGVGTLAAFKESLGADRRSYYEMRFESLVATSASLVRASARRILAFGGSVRRRVHRDELPTRR